MQIALFEPLATRKVAARILSCVVVILCGTSLMAQTHSSHPVRMALRAEHHSRTGDVRITPTKLNEGSSSIDIGSDRWVARGYDLRTLIAQIYDIDARRIDFPGDESNARYDVSLILPRDVDEGLMKHMLKDAIEHQFGLTITPESRPMDVYVLTSPNGPGAALHRHRASGDAQQITFQGKNCSGESSGTEVSATGGTIAEFSRTLEPELDRLLVDETDLRGSYDFTLGSYANQQELFHLLREHLGIVVTAARRSVTILTVRP